MQDFNQIVDILYVSVRCNIAGNKDNSDNKTCKINIRKIPTLKHPKSAKKAFHWTFWFQSNI